MITFENDYLIVALHAVKIDPNKSTCYDVVANGNFVGKAVYGDVYNDLIFFAINDVKYRDTIVASLPTTLEAI